MATVLLRDDFSGSGTMQGRVPDGINGGAWQTDSQWGIPAGGGLASYSQITGGYATTVDDVHRLGAYAPLAGNPSDAYVEAQFTLAALTDGASIGICRVQGGTDYVMVNIVPDASGLMQLSWANGSGLDDTHVSLALPNNSLSFKVRLEVRGIYGMVYIDDVPAFTNIMAQPGIGGGAILIVQSTNTHVEYIEAGSLDADTLTTSIFDKFSYFTSINLVDHTANIGGGYTMSVGFEGDFAGLVVQSNRLWKGSGDAGATIAYSNATGLPRNNFYIECLVSFQSNNFCELTFYRTGNNPANSDALCLLSFLGYGSATLYGSTGASADVSGILTTNKDYTLRVEFEAHGTDTWIRYVLAGRQVLTEIISGDPTWFVGPLGLNMYDFSGIQVMRVGYLVLRTNGYVAPAPPPPPAYTGVSISIPSGLPLPLRDEYSSTREENRASQEFETGPKRRRRTTTVEPRIEEISWILSQIQYHDFDYWWQYTIKGGKLPFDLQLVDNDGGLMWYTAQWIGPYKSRIDHERYEWQISGTLKILTDPFATRPAGTDSLHGVGFIKISGKGQLAIAKTLRGKATLTISGTGKMTPTLRGKAVLTISGKGHLQVPATLHGKATLEIGGKAYLQQNTLLREDAFNILREDGGKINREV